MNKYLVSVLKLRRERNDVFIRLFALTHRPTSAE